MSMNPLGMSPETALAVAAFGPLVTAALVALLGRWPNIREAATLITSSGIFAVVATVLWPAMKAGERPTLHLVEVMDGLNLAFTLEPLGLLFALVATSLWPITSLYAVGYLRGHGETNQTRFFICFALAIAGALGVAFSANLFTLFIFYEAITLSTFPLVTHNGDENAMRSGRVYLGILMSTSICFLLFAVIWTQIAAGTTEFRAGGILGELSTNYVPWLLALFAFGTAKAALMPFHRWLPAAMVAPTPVSALLHAVAVVKAGVFTITKVVVYVFGLDLLRETSASSWLVLVASFTLLSASIVALYQDNLKRRLAYSTIGQLAYIVLGAALVSEQAVIGAGLHIATHAFGKITLFFCAGAIMVGAHRKKVSQLDGLGWRMPFTFGAFLIGSLSIIGIPPFAGAWSKWWLASGALESGRLPILALYMVSSLLAIGYLMPVVARAFARRPELSEEDKAKDPVHEPLFCVLPPVLTAIGCMALFFGVDPLITLLEGMLP